MEFIYIGKLILVLLELQNKERFERIHRTFLFLCMLWQTLLGSLLLFCNFSEFPNKHRPPCTTMPWNIWPALVVLWGVCWMFYEGSSPIDDTQSQSRLADDQIWVPISDISNGLNEQDYHQYPYTSNVDFSSNFLEYGSLQTPHPELFASLPSPGTQFALTAGEVPLQNFPVTPYPHLDVTLSEPLEPEVIYTTEALFASTVDHPGQLAISLPDNTAGAFEGTGQTYFKDQHAARIAGHQNIRYPQVPAPPTVAGYASQAEQVAVLPHQPMTYKRSEVPPQNAEGKMICKHAECSNLAFTRKCDWKKHMDKHERPYRCTIDGCDHTQGFTSKGDLLRHERIVNKLHSGQHNVLFCDEPGCARGPGGSANASFSRKDNLADHIRRKHGRTTIASSHVPRRVQNANDTILHDVGLELPQCVDDEPVTSPQRKRRRISETDLSSQNADRGDREGINLRNELKRMRQVEQDMKNELTNMEQRVEELTKKLKDEQQKHEEKIEKLVGIIEQLVRQTK